MNYSDAIKSHKWILVILVIAAVLRLYHLNFQSIWMDEIYTLNVANPNASFSTMISEINLREGFPYLYFIIMKTMLSVFGYGPIVARLFSVVMGLASVWMIYKFGKLIYSERTGLIAASLVTVSEFCIYASQDARPYTFYFFAVVLCFYGLVKFLRDFSMRNAVIYGLIAGFLLNVNFFSFINMFTQYLIIAGIALLLPKEQKWIFLRRAVIAGVIALILFLPNIKVLIKLLAFKSAWIPAPTNESMTLMFKEFLGNSEMTLFLFTPLFLFFLFNLFKTKDASTYEQLLENKNAFAFWILMPWAAVYILVVFVKSYTDTSLMVTRYFVSVLPVLFLLFSQAITLIKNKIIRFSVFAFLVGLMLINNIIVKQYYRVPCKTQWRETADFVKANNTKNEQVYTGVKYWFDYFFAKDGQSPLIEKPSLEALFAEMAADSSKVKPFWFMEAHGRPFALSETAQQFANTHFYVESNYDGLDTWTKHYALIKDMPQEVDISKYADLQQYNGDSFAFNIETYENDGKTLKVSGWAYFDGQDAKKSNVDVVLIAGGKAKRLQILKVARPDVTTYFKSKFDLSNSGFSASYDLSKLPSGSYKVGVHLSDTETKKEGLILTDKVVEIK